MKKIFSSLVLLLIFSTLKAQTPGLQIDMARIDITVNKNGTVLIDEIYHVDFLSPHHGIYRSIPFIFKDIYGKRRRIKIENIQAYYCDRKEEVKAPFHTIRKGRKLFIYIGSKKKLITGRRCYELLYTLDGAIIKHKNKPWQLLYVTAVGPGWKVPLNNVNISVNTEILEKAAVKCWQFPEGKLCEKDNGKFVIGTINPGEQIIVGIAWKKPWLPVRNYPPYSFTAFIGMHALIGMLLLWIASLFVLWLKKGRDPKLHRSIMVEYEPPKELSPVEAGLLWDFSFDGRDFAAAIVDLAVKGYIKIEELEKKILFIKSEDYRITVTKDINPKKVPREEYILAKELIGTKVGDRTTLSEITSNRKKIRNTLEKIRKDIEKRLKTIGYIERGAAEYGWVIAVSFLLFMVSAAISLLVFKEGGEVFFLNGKIPAILVLWVTGFITVIYSTFMYKALAKRTRKGALLKKWLEGFREFVKRAEINRIKALFPPEKYPVVFESYFPYALALGVGEEWAQIWERIFRSLNRSYTPGWYSGGSLSNLSSFAHSFTTTASSSSGSGGTGGAGGGGGGGW